MADAVGHVGADGVASDLVHSHTWYANLGGHLAGLLHGIPHVVTAHSLEPLRPWKAEQLGGGYALSSWAEKTAYEGAAAVIAVSGGMREDILRSYPSVDPDRVKVVHNGIDLDQWQRPTTTRPLARADATVRALGIDPSRPSVVFVGRITRQKGLPYFLRAVELLPPDVQVVLCAGAPDTPEILAEVTGLVDELRTRRTGIVWIEQMLPRDELIAVLSHGTVFACPSVYEPLGIVNLEAMAVGLPVVGTATGGIPEVIDDGVTGRLVPIDQLQDGTGTPVDPAAFVADLGAALTDARQRHRPDARSGASRRATRVEDHFSWEAVAERTLDVYRGGAGLTPRPPQTAGQRSPRRHRPAGHPVDVAQRGRALVGLPQVDRGAVVLGGQRDDRAQPSGAGQHAHGPRRRARPAAARRAARCRAARRSTRRRPSRQRATSSRCSASVTCSSPWRRSRSASASEPVVRVHRVPPVRHLGDLPRDQVPGLEVGPEPLDDRHRDDARVRACARGRPRRRRSPRRSPRPASRRGRPARAGRSRSSRGPGSSASRSVRERLVVTSSRIGVVRARLVADRVRLVVGLDRARAGVRDRRRRRRATGPAARSGGAPGRCPPDQGRT